MNNTCKVLLAALAFGAGGIAQAAAQTTEAPIITFHTTIYDQQGETNQFHIVLGSTEAEYFDIDYGYGMEELYVEPAYFDQDAQAISGTTVQCRVNEAGLVKIYGDASKIDYLDAEGCYIDWIDMDACTNLQIIDLQHNELKSLDLTPFTKVQALYLTDNPFTPETPLIVGPNKPELMILEIDITDYVSPTFNLSDYPALVSFDAYHCRSLTSIDPTGCPELQVLSLELTDVASVDVSQNPKLTRLNVSDTRITSLDISNNIYLQHLLAEHTSGTINTDVKLSSVDLSNNPNLIILSLCGNDMTSVNLSANTLITNLNLSKNKLTSLNLDTNAYLYSVNVSNNDLDFATLPLPSNEWGEYYYFREPMACERSYPVEQPIDFSSRVLRSGTTTTATVWSAPIGSEPVELDAEAYTYTDGKVTFHQAPADSVYIQYANSAFTEYTLRTGCFKVKEPGEYGQPSPIVTFTTSATATLNIGLSISNPATTAPRTVHVAVGDKAPATFTVSSSDPTALTNIAVGQVAANTKVVIKVDENDVLTGLDIADVPMSNIDLTGATELRTLRLHNCRLLTVNLANNRSLRSLDVSGNRLGNFSLAGANGSYEKTMLTDINAADNDIYNFEVVINRQIRNLNLSGNRLTEIGLKDYDNILSLNLSDNRLTGELNLVYLTQATDINISGNKIDSVTIAEMPELKNFNISNNAFSIKTLPVVSASQAYTYAPQQPLEIMDKAPGINISAQYRDINGQTTTFTWKKADGTPLVEGVDMTCNRGATRFLDENIGKVYCEMTHPAFPKLSGANVYKTTETLVVGAPTIVVATFKVAAGTDAANVIFTGTKTSSLYIDWRGDGTEFLQYPMVANTYSSYTDQTAYAGATAKVYTYDTPDVVKVFSIYGVEMESMDASPLTAVSSLSIGGAGLDETSLKLPAAPLKELNLQGNHLSSKTFEEYTDLQMLVLSNNDYENFDLSKYPTLQTAMLAGNKLTSVNFANNQLWGLDLSDNQLESISLTGLPALSQIMLGHNKLSSLNLDAVSGTLRVLDVTDNRFIFSTLPLASTLPLLNNYYYSNQAAVPVECIEGKIDLSSEASVSGTATSYAWYLGEPYLDTETGEISGEALVTGDDDPEYTVTDGITSFHYTFSEDVTGVMTNALYPNLYLFTTPVSIDHAAGINDIEADNSSDPDALVDVYTAAGICIRRNVRTADAITGLAPGLYIVGSQKKVVK